MGLSDLDTIPETGAVFTVGRSRFADNVASHFFIRKDPVVSITCGDEHSAVICQSGRLFVFGSNDWGQLGLGHKNHVSKPSCVKILKPEKVTHVACGRAHTLICTGSQKIFACGSDQEGQLGRGISAIGDSASTPVLVYDTGLSGPKILQIEAGSHHSLALTSDGGVFAWGSNLEGQLGLPDVSGLVNKPTKVHIPEPVKQIGTGYYHSTFLTESGLVYVCGESESGKLGIDVNFSSQAAPKQMQLPCTAVHVACGGHHTIVLAENGNLYCTGSNSSGQLGLGANVTELHTPKLLSRGSLQNETITRISCGESHTAIVTGTGKLFTCGDGRHGKLGLEENENNVHELTFAPRYKELFVTNVACGGCHTILVAHRRETNNREIENTQTEHIQKRSSLPPLKVPVNRLQNESRQEKITEKGNETSNMENNNIENSHTMNTESKETSNENGMHNQESVTNGVNDSHDSTKNNSPKKSRENSPRKMSSDITSNEIKSDVPTKDEPSTTEPQESNEQNEEKESKNEENESKNEENESKNEENDNEKSGMGVNTENNVQETEKSETMNPKQNNTENEINKENTGNSLENEEQMNEVNNKKSVEQSNSEDNKSKSMESSKEMEPTDDVRQEMSPKKQMSPVNSTPPPKPPRLKSGSENSASMERTTSTEMENEDTDANKDTTKEESPVKKAGTSENESVKKHEPSSRKSSMKSESSRSSRSKVDTEETIEIDRQNDNVGGKEKVIEEEKMNDNAQDDADVVQSPAPKTSKMSKIFKGKKQQAVENGTKAGGNINHKPKSKTCVIL